jgi:hypothetical protein
MAMQAVPPLSSFKSAVLNHPEIIQLKRRVRRSVETPWRGGASTDNRLLVKFIAGDAA